MNKLLSMVDFVEEIKDYVHESHNYDRAIELIFEYSTFLKKPLELGMFIPCSEDGRILIEPTESNSIYWSEEYKKAKKNVLFHGFEVDEFSALPNITSVINRKLQKHIYISNDKLIQDVVLKYKPLELTEWAIKQIGL